MEGIEELRKWVEILSPSERRQVSMLGKMRSGTTESQHVRLFQWLCNSEEGASLPPESPLQRNLPTSIARLKSLILDSLRLLNADRDLDARLRTALDEVAQLYTKQLYPQALRLVTRNKAIALQRCRYPEGLQFLHWEWRIQSAIQIQLPPDQINALCVEESDLLLRLQQLLELRQRHERLLSLVRHNALPRGNQLDAEVEALADSPLVPNWAALKGYLERALACNILGIRHLLLRRSFEAVQLYATLLEEWRQHPEWLSEHASLLLTICNYFQTACFYSKMDGMEARRYLEMVPDFSSMGPEPARHFQRMIFHGQLTPALNTGNLELVASLIPDIDRWLQANASHLSVAQVLPFLHNFAVSNFLMDAHQVAFRYVQRVLNTPHRKVRRDIRDFALVLQSVLQYELGDLELIEYLTRAGKRHFEAHTREMEFERSVLRCLERVMGLSDPEAIAQQWERLGNELTTLSNQLPGTVPILGLTEMQLWAKSKLERRSLRAVFMEAVNENLKAM
ncbi:MAG: hypothetical protein U0176_25220 [Bacteroidia bacterium]